MGVAAVPPELQPCNFDHGFLFVGRIRGPTVASVRRVPRSDGVPSLIVGGFVVVGMSWFSYSGGRMSGLKSVKPNAPVSSGFWARSAVRTGVCGGPCAQSSTTGGSGPPTQPPHFEVWESRRSPLVWCCGGFGCVPV